MAGDARGSGGRDARRIDTAGRYDGRVHIVLLVFGLLVTVLGIGLLAVPAVPAIGIIFSGVALVAWADGFARIG